MVAGTVDLEPHTVGDGRILPDRVPRVPGLQAGDPDGSVTIRNLA